MSALRLWLGLALRRHGALPWASLGLSFVAAVLHFLVLPMLVSRHHALDAALLQARFRPPASASAATSLPAEGAAKQSLARRDALFAVLVDESELPRHLEDLFRRGERLGLSLLQADYRHRRDVAAGVGAVEIRLPLRGAYLPIRQFIEQTLLGSPGIALDELRLRRALEDSMLLDAQLRFVIYVRESPR